MRVAMMQPYLFPYLGYFQLVNAVDVFVFADDVNFIKGGFINRNKILHRNEERYFTVPCSKRSQNKLINEVGIATKMKGYPDTIPLTIRHAYSKAPFFTEVFPLVESIFRSEIDTISGLAATSVEKVSEYLGIDVDFKFSSASFSYTKGQEKSDRLVNITKDLGGTIYVNPIGGRDLYCQNFFENKGIKLDFLRPESIKYPQFNCKFTPNLSIIDVMMFNSKEDIHRLLDQYRLL
ncbi:WbqC family protein [Ulvibacterium sp.]|uniref:WbqC family protein n=1 Tax=Ulvibacterium sp. TaxID=2665914 RepID=UPI003CC6B2A6